MKAVRILAAIVIGSAALLVASCSTTPPQIVQTFWQVNLVHNPHDGSSRERLSFFVHVSISDGLSDLDKIYLLNDKHELYWRLDPSNWETSDRDGELWVGSNFLQMPGSQAFPRGDYRVLVSNLAGERATASIFVSADHLDAATVAFPRLAFDSGKMMFTGRTTDTSVWLYNLEGQFAGSRQATAAGIPLSRLLPGAGPRMLTAYAYAYDAHCGCGLISGPYDVSGGS